MGGCAITTLILMTPETRGESDRAAPMMTAKTPRLAMAGGSTTIASLPDDVLLVTLSHLPERCLASFGCTSRKMLVLVAAERLRQHNARAKVLAQERRERRHARAHFANYEDDARVVATVIRHMLAHAPLKDSVVCQDGRKKVVTPPGGVCRLRVGIRERGITMNERNADWMCNVIAMQETALRAVEFQGKPLGAAGVEVALRQAKVLKLDVPENIKLYGRVFKLFIRADIIQQYLNHSPALAGLVSGGPA